jgi:hypothetical protein
MPDATKTIAKRERKINMINDLLNRTLYVDLRPVCKEVTADRNKTFWCFGTVSPAG